MRFADRRRGFTFVELLAAMLFLAIVIPVAVQGLTLANGVASRATHKRQAILLAERVLNECAVTASWRDGDQEGDFADDAPGFAWSIKTEPWEHDALTLVTVEVRYVVQGRGYGETLSTVVRDPDTAAGGTS